MKAKRPSLSLAQLKLLSLLAEPYSHAAQDGWNFRHSKRRSLEILAARGLAKYIDSSKHLVGYCITSAGRKYLRSKR